jgi:predicted small metal-binding protein
VLRYACRTAGFDCDAVFSTKTGEQMTEQIHKHAIEVHGLEASDLSPELMRKVKASIELS